MKRALVLGAGGFIGSHMVKRLKDEGYWVRGVDLEYPKFGKSKADDFCTGDLRSYSTVRRMIVDSFQEPYYTAKAFDEVYQFAADMGGAGYVFSGAHDADIMHNSAMINLNVLDALKEINFKGKIFYSSSACMYPQGLQTQDVSLKESDAYPGDPDSEYGWEKLFSERLFLAYARNYGIDIRIARFHNIFGPEGAYQGGKEKAPAAICRKVIESTPHYLNGGLVGTDGIFEIEIWGDGNQTRSFLYIDECIEGVRRLMESDYKQPINIGSDELISINDLAKMIINLSGKNITIKHIDGPQGVRGRNSDNTLINEKLGWKPSQPLIEGIKNTFNWIKSKYE